MDVFITNLIFVSLCVGVLILLLSFTQAIFKKKYQIKIRQFIWILLALRLAVPLQPLNNSIFTFSTETNETVNSNGNDINYILTNNLHNNPQTTKLHIKNNTLYLYNQRTIKKSDNSDYITYDLQKDSYTKDSRRLQSIINSAQYRIIYDFTKFLNFIEKNQVIIFTIYISVFFIFIIYHLAALFIYNRKLKENLYDADERIQDIFRQAVLNVNLSRKISIYLSTEITSPMVIGFIHPIIILPFSDFTNYELKLAITHELFHIKHNDLLIKYLYFLANAIHWFNPLVYYAVREAQKDMELYCDYSVVSAFEKEQRIDYNELLYRILELSSPKPKQIFFSTCMSSGTSEMMERFKSNLDISKKDIGFIPFIMLICMTLFLSVLFSLNKTSLNETMANTRQTANLNTNSANGSSDVFNNFSKLAAQSGPLATVVPDYTSQKELEKMLETYDTVSSVYTKGDKNAYVNPYKRKDGAYMIPCHTENTYRTIVLDWVKMKGSGKALSKAPEINIYIKDTPVTSYGVTEEDYNNPEKSVAARNKFFAEQCSKRTENPCFEVESGEIYNGDMVQLMFPTNQVPDSIDVKDVVLNEDGTSRWPDTKYEIIFRTPLVYTDLGYATFNFADHSAISENENLFSSEKETNLQPYYRGFEITCYYVNEDGLQTYKYFVVCRSQAVNSTDSDYSTQDISATN